MSKAYQVITEQGLVIPPALCASAQLGQLGSEVLLEIEAGKIAIRPARRRRRATARRALPANHAGRCFESWRTVSARTKCRSDLVVYRQP